MAITPASNLYGSPKSKNQMLVRASFIIGIDGSSTISASSIGLSTAVDRERFRQLRSECDVVLIGGNTARSEPYASLKKPLVVLTHENQKLIKEKSDCYQFNLSIAEVLPILQTKFGSHILIEAGWRLLKEAIELKLIDELYLTINHTKKGENLIDLNLIERFLIKTDSKIIDGTELTKYIKRES